MALSASPSSLPIFSQVFPQVKSSASDTKGSMESQVTEELRINKSQELKEERA